MTKHAAREPFAVEIDADTFGALAREMLGENFLWARLHVGGRAFEAPFEIRTVDRGGASRGLSAQLVQLSEFGPVTFEEAAASNPHAPPAETAKLSEVSCKTENGSAGNEC